MFIMGKLCLTYELGKHCTHSTPPYPLCCLASRCLESFSRSILVCEMKTNDQLPMPIVHDSGETIKFYCFSIISQTLQRCSVALRYDALSFGGCRSFGAARGNGVR